MKLENWGQRVRITSKTMKASSIVVGCLSFLFTACPLPEKTLFYHIRDSTFSAQNVRANHVEISEIVFSWHPKSAADAFAHHSAFETKVIWKASAVRRVELAGLEFPLFRAPPGFKTVVDESGELPAGGVFSLDLYSGVGEQRKIFISHEFPRGFLPNS
jgi:hypothetical protein